MQIEDIQKVVAKHYGVTVEEILGTDRSDRVALPRKVAMYVARKYTTESLPAISKAFDRTHAAVIHCIKSLERQVDCDEKLRSDIEAVRKESIVVQYVPEKISGEPMEELIRIFKGAGEERTIRVNGDPAHVTIGVESNGGDTVINIWTR